MTGQPRRIMRIFEAQDRARRRAVLLILLWIFLTAVLVVPAYMVAWFLSQGWPLETPLPGVDAPGWDARLGLGTAAVVFGTVLAGSWVQWNRLQKGGAVVARLLGGRPVSKDPEDPGQRQLRNVTEEMALAAGLPVPDLFLLRAEPGINAFAAGLTPESSAIGVTAGALERLDRDELQAVVAHELGHIAQGDARLRTVSLALVHGFLSLSLAGAALMGGGLSRRVVRPGPTLVFGVALTVVGAMGAGLARVFQAAVGREREYLADARGAQFTRAPVTLASALRKTGGDPDAARVRHHYQAELRHLFFSSGLTHRTLGLLATHPPLDQRIRRLDPDWDGSYVFTRLPEDSMTARIADALAQGRKTTIPEGSGLDPGWSGSGGLYGGPGSSVQGMSRLREARTAKGSGHSGSRPRPPRVRLPAGDGAGLGWSAGVEGDPGLPEIPPGRRLHSLNPLREEVVALLVAAAWAAESEEAAVRERVASGLAWLFGPDQVPVEKLEAELARGSDPSRVDPLLGKLRRLAPGLGRRLLISLTFAVDREGSTTEAAGALVRGCSRTLGVELPPQFTA